MAKRKKTAFQKCVGAKLRGKHHKGKRAQKAAFKKAVKACKKKGKRKR